MKKKSVIEGNMHKFLVYACKSQDFAQSQKFFAWSHRVSKGNKIKIFYNWQTEDYLMIFIFYINF